LEVAVSFQHVGAHLCAPSMRTHRSPYNNR
jgi:hypothetical protein